MNETDLIFKIISTIGGTGSLAVLAFLWKAGFFKKNGNGIQLEELKKSVNAIGENHINHLHEKLDRIIEKQTEILVIIRSLVDEMKDIKSECLRR